MAEAFNFHVNLWPEGGGAPTYLCLLCPMANYTYAEIVSHLSAVHEALPVPTPLAASTTSPARLRTLGIQFTKEPDHAPIPDLSHGNR